MTAKFLALISVIGLATVCVVQAQSPTSNESPAASPSPAEKAASPSPAESPAASPKAKPTPKKAKAQRKARRAARRLPAGRTTEEAANPPAPGGGHGQVWVNTETRVYHREGSRFYGTTRKGKYMIEQDAIQAGYKPAPKGP
jgi:pyruvate/2-oxoglutarate dehydrogenase complex dihydrolipoamide acyltransferase (E2) component